MGFAGAPRRRSHAALRACCSATTCAARRDPTRARMLRLGSHLRRVRPLARRDRAWSYRARLAHRSSPPQQYARQRARMGLLLLLRLLPRLQPCPRRSATSRRLRPPTRAPGGRPAARTNPRRKADAGFACEPKGRPAQLAARSATPCALLIARAPRPARITRLCTAAAVARTAGLQRPTADCQCADRCADRRAASATDARMAGRIVSARLSCRTSQLQRAG